MAAIESRARVGLVLLAATVLAGASCSAPEPATRAAGGAESVVAVPTPVAATSTPPATTPPIDVLAAMPAEAKQHTAKGAEAFARYFFETSSRLAVSPVRGEFSKLCVAGAKPCAWREDTLQEMVVDGWRSNGPELTVDETAIISDTPLSDKYAYVTVMITQFATRKIASSGTDLGEYTAAKAYPADVGLEWTSSGWRVSQAGKPENTKPKP